MSDWKLGGLSTLICFAPATKGVAPALAQAPRAVKGSAREPAPMARGWDGAPAGAAIGTASVQGMLEKRGLAVKRIE